MFKMQNNSWIAKIPKKLDFDYHNYNSKYMNSVWGLYNRYAPQAFQKNEELFQRSQTVSSNAK